MSERIDQTIFASDPKRQGNCLAACVATFLEVPLGAVPHFIEYGEIWKAIPDEPDRHSWWAMFVGFMSGRGLWPTALDSPNDADSGEVVFVMGMSPRGVCHQVLYRDGDLWHDPHPSRDGVLDIREVLAWRPGTHDHAPTEPAEPTRPVTATKPGGPHE